ncbi:hypothetical protein KCG48_09065 [Proteiniclasticum sp. BAD-10]|uniref:Phosphotyrosine protein phosphatase I domain-containing protein n=1 Tax=Proteiniclasticum sediminis TaxID=2804028 RepID=A0A941CQY4_9CLOT|nr:hypothetical protein [Proteiniclasticum sediminis]MBR0576489.1 hypothetical protein [Proteiniclasticum sediminis]
MKMAFVCNGSSIRAQLAAAVAREFFPEAEISAAGSLEETANPEALAVLEEDELSLEGIALKTLFDLDFDLDYAVVVGCDEGGCPLVFANKVIEWDFIPNPQGQGVEVYREAKNQLKEELKKLYLEMQ